MLVRQQSGYALDTPLENFWAMADTISTARYT